jgi:hypothetical protein
MGDLFDSAFAAFSAHEPGGGFACAQRAERRQITVHRVKIPQAWLRNSRLQRQATLHISGA